MLSYDPFELDVVQFDPANPFAVPGPDAAAGADGDERDRRRGDGEDDDDSIKSPNMTHLTFHKVLVTGVQFDQSDSSVVDAPRKPPRTATRQTADEETVERAPSNELLVTLALSSPEVEQVVFAAEFGHIWLTAENADADENGTRIVTLGRGLRRPPRWRGDEPSTRSPRRGARRTLDRRRGRVATTVAVLGEDRILAEQATDADRAPTTGCTSRRGGTATICSTPTQIVLELAAAGASVVCVGADVPLPIAFGVAAIVDRDHPEMSVVLVASPNEDVWREALRAGVRDVIEPGRVDLELDDAIERAVERTARAREQRPQRRRCRRRRRPAG